MERVKEKKVERVLGREGKRGSDKILFQFKYIKKNKTPKMGICLFKIKAHFIQVAYLKFESVVER